jgi:DNA polymerase-3 subunit beta
LIEGQFPNYRQLLPESYEHDVRVSRGELLEVARRVSQLAQRNAPLRLAFSSGELTVAAETPDVGDARESIPVSFEGEPLEIGFNAEFLKDGIDSVEGDELLVRLISPLRPGLLQPVDGDDFSYLVMPIRLNV